MCVAFRASAKWPCTSRPLCERAPVRLSKICPFQSEGQLNCTCRTASRFQRAPIRTCRNRSRCERAPPAIAVTHACTRGSDCAACVCAGEYACVQSPGSGLGVENAGSPSWRWIGKIRDKVVERRCHSHSHSHSLRSAPPLPARHTVVQYDYESHPRHVEAEAARGDR